MKLATDADLRPYGYRPGTLLRYCAACNSEQGGMGGHAFKCFRCAVKQYREVEKTLRSCADTLPANDLPDASACAEAA